MNTFKSSADASIKCQVFTGEEHSQQFTRTTNYIDVKITCEQKQKIISALKDSNLGVVVPNFIALFWAAQKVREPFVLTTTSQPFGVCGNNKKLVSYLNACKKHNWYAHVERGTAIGLPARVFMRGDHEQTQDVHGYPQDWRPASCEDAIFSEKWGSFAVIVGLHDKRLGVLEIVTDTIKESYEDDIDRLRTALEKAGLQYSFPKLADPKKMGSNQRKVTRETNSRKIARYNYLAPFFGQPAEIVREIITKENDYHKGVGETTFRTICREINIPVWPGQSIKRKPKESTTGGRPKKSATTSSASRTPLRQSETHHVSVEATSEITIGYDLSVQESNERGSPSIENPVVYVPDMAFQNDFEFDFQNDEPLNYEHEIENPYFLNQTASEISDMIRELRDEDIDDQCSMREWERPNFVEDFDEKSI